MRREGPDGHRAQAAAFVTITCNYLLFTLYPEALCSPHPGMSFVVSQRLVILSRPQVKGALESRTLPDGTCHMDADPPASHCTDEVPKPP